MHQRRANRGGSQHGGASGRWLSWAIGLGVVLVAGGVSLAASPRANLSPGGRGIAQLTGLTPGTHVLSAQFQTPSGAIPVTARGDGLYPLVPVRSGWPGLLQVRLAGPALLSWLPWNTRLLAVHLKTPSMPRVVTRQVTALADGAVTIQFQSAVSRVGYHASYFQHRKVKVLPGPRRTVTLALPPTGPGSHGVLDVEAVARPWERGAKLQQIHWTTMPYLTARRPVAQVNATGQLIVKFSQPIRFANLEAWRLSPGVPGTWHRDDATTFVFQPSGPWGFGPGAGVSVTLPSGSHGPTAKSGSYLKTAVTLSWTTPPGSVLRLQQLLAQEGYLPVSWRSAVPPAIHTVSAQVATIDQPPAGTFQWKYAHLPNPLKALWVPGQMTAVTEGAIMQFERANGLPVDGIAGPAVWKALIADQLAGRLSPDGYSYISVTEGLPQTLELWVNGKLVLKTLTNTGIPATPTYLGTFPIYERLRFQIMKGKNPNGVPYADPVYWINYFKGGDAVHGFVRQSYGFPQSLGCVEVPPSVAHSIYRDVHYGTLVTVNPPGVPPAPAT